jgi:hypothetical protein
MRRLAVLAVALVLAARVGAAEDKAKSRDGSSSSGSSSAGSRHHSSSSSSSSSSKSGDSGTSSSSSSSSSSTPTPAQRRHPRAGTGTGDYPHDDYHYDYGYDYGYSPSFYFGYPAYYTSGYPGAYGYAAPPYYSSYADTGSLRVMVDPAITRVYVDGYYAGTADDFDGLLQRLHVSAGRHEIMLKLDGYRTRRFRVYVPVGHTVKLRHDMARGAGEDTEDLTSEEPEVRGGPAGYARMKEEGQDARVGDPRSAMPADTGRLRVDVYPPDASIYIDGVFRGAARAMDGVLLPSGRHHAEIVRPGYRTAERDIEVRSGETTDLRADLER